MSDQEAPLETYPSGIPKPDLSALSAKTDVLVLTGMSGAGRTKAAGVLADLGWYVVDNIPPHLLAELAATVRASGDKPLAAVVDVRGGKYFDDLTDVIADLEERDTNVRLIFLDASDRTLVARYEEARRLHPLQAQGTILEGLAKEREILREVQARADVVIDTSHLNIHELRQRLVQELGQDDDDLHINVLSFGFKNGLPVDAEYVADVRFLPNPHWVASLKPQSGLDEDVRDYVLADTGAQEFLDGYLKVLDIALKQYRSYDKPAITVAIGCTGGRHRSVAIAEALSEGLRDRGLSVRTTHRDIAR